MTIDEFNAKLDQFAKEYPADASDALQKGAQNGKGTKSSHADWPDES